MVALLCVAILNANVIPMSSATGCGPASASAEVAEVGPAGSEAKPEVFQKGSIKFLGGPGFPDFNGRETWGNELVVSGTEAVCTFADKKLEPVSFALDDVTTILYGQASSRRAGTWVSVGVILAPIALLGLLHKSRKHNILISWKGDAGQDRGVYLQVQGYQLRRLLNTLSYRTAEPVFADATDRKWLLTQGVQAELDPAGTTATK